MTEKLSIQLYTLRGLGGADRVMAAAAEAGFRHVELVGSHLEDPAATKRLLDANGLTVSSSHVGLAALRERPERLAAACRTLGFAELYMPAVPPEQREMDAAGWRAMGGELARLASRMQAEGVRLGYHNHHWELAEKAPGKTALELLFESAGTSPLGWQVDVAWLVRGGADPKAWMKRYAARVTSAHVKDIAPAGQNEDQDGWADVGSGVLDWKDLWQACRAAGAGWMVVEHDKPADPAQSAKNSFAFLSTVEA